MKMKRGFSLIEILVVISIIGLLGSIVFGSVSSVREKARRAAMKVEVKQIVLAATLAADTYGYYPNDSHGSVTCPKDIVLSVLGGKKWGEFINICTDPWGNQYEWNNLCRNSTGIIPRSPLNAPSSPCPANSDANPGPIGITVVGKNGVNDNCTGDDTCFGSCGHSQYNWNDSTGPIPAGPICTEDGGTPNPNTLQTSQATTVCDGESWHITNSGSCGTCTKNNSQTANWCTVTSQTYNCTNACTGATFSSPSGCGTCQLTTSCNTPASPAGCPGSSAPDCLSNSSTIADSCNTPASPARCPGSSAPDCSDNLSTIADSCGALTSGPGQCIDLPTAPPSCTAQASVDACEPSLPGPPWSCVLKSPAENCGGGAPRYTCTAACSYTKNFPSCSYTKNDTTYNNTVNSITCTDSCGGTSCSDYIQNYTCTNACTGAVTTQPTPCAGTCTKDNLLQAEPSTGSCR